MARLVKPGPRKTPGSEQWEIQERWEIPEPADQGGEGKARIAGKEGSSGPSERPADSEGRLWGAEARPEKATLAPGLSRGDSEL